MSSENLSLCFLKISCFFLIQVFLDNGNEKIIPKTSEVYAIIRSYYEKHKGENCHRLIERRRGNFARIRRNTIQNWINSNRQHCKKHPIFQNKDCLKPVVAENPMNICQIDLVVMEKNPSKDKSNKICQYIQDFFSHVTPN